MSNKKAERLFCAFRFENSLFLTSSRPLNGDGIPHVTVRVSCFAGGCLSGTTLSDWSYTASTGISLSASPAVASQSHSHQEHGTLPGGQVTSSQIEERKRVYIGETR